ncbi:hypothetical protein Naga_100522g1, partial [Nannochloropsis gaditana]
RTSSPSLPPSLPPLPSFLPPPKVEARRYKDFARKLLSFFHGHREEIAQVRKLRESRAKEAARMTIRSSPSSGKAPPGREVMGPEGRGSEARVMESEDEAKVGGKSKAGRREAKGERLKRQLSKLKEKREGGGGEGGGVLALKGVERGLEGRKEGGRGASRATVVKDQRAQARSLFGGGGGGGGGEGGGRRGKALRPEGSTVEEGMEEAEEETSLRSMPGAFEDKGREGEGEEEEEVEVLATAPQKHKVRQASRGETEPSEG